MLSASGRPPAVSHWIQCGRKFSSPPKISDLAVFANSFNVWWTSLQPTSRITSDNGRLSRNVTPDEAWSKTRKGGKNGFYTILLTLSFWIRRATLPAEQSAYENLIDDVVWVVNQMLGSTVPTHPKRAGEDARGGPSKRFAFLFFFSPSSAHH